MTSPGLPAAERYHAEALARLGTLLDKQRAALDRAATLCTEAIAADGLVHLFGVGHSRMGGHAVGEKASAKAVRDIPHTYHKHTHEGPALALRKAFLEANAGIHAVGQENPEFRGMSSSWRSTGCATRCPGPCASKTPSSSVNSTFATTPSAFHRRT